MLLHETQIPGFWERIRLADEYKFMLEQLEEAHEKYKTSPIQALKYSEFKLYEATGSRAEYEKSYFDRRGRLNTYAALSLIHGNREYIETLEDIIWAVCDEYTWALPAHINIGDVSAYPVSIDLFASETGFALSEIYYLLRDKLSVPVVDRLKIEINRRIIHSYEENPPSGWEKASNNWSAVCAAGVAASYFYIAPERFYNVENRLANTMNCFLSGYESDGACLEGISYWGYGFGFFVYYAQLLKEFTGGKTDLFNDKKVAQIARFQERACLSDGVYMTFSDASINHTGYPLGLTHFLHKQYGSSIGKIEYAAGLYADHCYRWAMFIRNFVWYDETAASCEAPAYTDFYFDKSEIFIIKRQKFSFAAKCGNNGEPHNHNDVGSFIFAADGRQIVCDFGMGEYTRQYFSESRYEFLVNSSRGHSVPIINGKYQHEGREYAGKVIRCNNGNNAFEIEISKAYDIPELSSLVRRFEIEDFGVTVKGEYEFSDSPASVVERIVTLIPPEIGNETVKLENIIIRFSADLFDCNVSKESYFSHDAHERTAYLIDFIVKEPKKNIKNELKITYG